MGTLGKLLLVFNLLLAAGVVFAASKDWAARKNIQANALHHNLVLAGMPVEPPADITGDSDSVPLGYAPPGSPRIDTVSNTFLNDHFKDAPGDGVGGTGGAKSQLDEAKAVKTKLDARLGGSPAEQLVVLCGKFTPDANRRPVYAPGILTPYADSFLEREAIRRLADTSAVTDRPEIVEQRATTARQMLDRKFEAITKINPAAADEEATQVKEKSEALKQKADDARAKFAAYEAAYTAAKDPANAAAQTALATATTEATVAAQALSAAQAALDKVFTDLGSSASRDERDRARRVAQLLVYANDTGPWQKRAALVVGLRNYAGALTEQSTRYGRMATSVAQQGTFDQARFSDEYSLLQNLAAGQAILLAQQVGVRVAKEQERAQEDEAATARRLKLAERRVDLAKVRGEVDAALAKQAEVEAKLLETQKQVSETLQKNADLEATLTAAESKAK